MTNGIIDQIVDFSKKLPSWQKILAILAFDRERSISDKEPEVDLSFKRFLYDVKLSDEPTGQGIIDEINALDVCNANNGTIIPELMQIKNCRNINAIASDQVITFAPKLTVIYGENASGKSGYVRLLSSVFYSRGDSKILPNILKPKAEQGTPEGVFSFKINGKNVQLRFPRDIDRPEFKCFACFDSKAVFAHLENSNELYVMPSEMNFFDRLVQLIKIVIEKIKHEISSKEKSNYFTKLLEGESPTKEFISNIDSKTNPAELCKLIENHLDIDSQLEKMEKEYISLKHSNPKIKLKEIKENKKQLKALNAEFTNTCNKYYNIDYYGKIKAAINNYNSAREDNEIMGSSSFQTDLLKTSGTKIWKKFIVSMELLVKEESNTVQRKFPESGDHCPLCLQHLQHDALNLFSKYFDFLKSDSEQAVRKTSDEIDQLTTEINTFSLPTFEDRARLYLWIEQNHNDKVINFSEIIKSFRIYKENLKYAVAKHDIKMLSTPQYTDITNDIDSIICSLDELASKYDEENYCSEIRKTRDHITQLKHKKIISSNYNEIKAFIKNLKWIEKARVECSKINTGAITKEHTRIFNDHFNKQYTQHFQTEANKLDVDFRIDVIPTGSLGRTARKLSFLKYPPTEILSEGQQKVLALADFLTEVEVCNINGGIIFDDPVNSLDHERRLAIARRLVQESKKRQVVILTHDLGFLSDLRNEVESHRINENEVYYHWVSKVGNNIGIIKLNHRRALESDYKKATKALEYLEQAKLTNDPLEIENLCKTGFDCLRQTYEAFILYELFAGTVVRFDRQIKYGQFKSVYCPEQYVNDVSKKLEYCSGFISGHLGADHAMRQTASPALLQQEINLFNLLWEKFRKERKKKAQESHYLVKDLMHPCIKSTR